MKPVAGRTFTVTIDREQSPYGFYVKRPEWEQDVLLHYTEVEGTIAPGDQKEIFIYYDTEDRIAATMKKPLIRLGEVALLEMVDRHPRIGSFLDMGLGRNLLLPYAEQPEEKDLRPIVGDKVYVLLDHDRQGRLIARLAGESELAPLAVHAPAAWNNRWIEGRVYKTLHSATYVICGGGEALGFGAIGMIHASERTRPLRVGEALQVRVGFIREDGRANLSMRPAKEIGRDVDAEKLLTFLHDRPNGAMPYSDETPADLIMTRFGISKSAFKRAIGKLMKEGLVYQRDNWTYLSSAGPAAAQSAVPAKEEH